MIFFQKFNWNNPNYWRDYEHCDRFKFVRANFLNRHDNNNTWYKIEVNQ
jgi:hypothetical protein